MLLWLTGVAALATLFVVWLARASFALTGNVQGRADPSGAWAVACGLALGPFALTGIAAAGVKPFLTCHVFGKQFARVPLSRWLKRKPNSERVAESAEKPEKNAERFELGLPAWLTQLDPLDALLSWWESERVVQIESLVLDLSYSFRDVALTGRILAAMYVLSAVLPEVVELRQTPGWESEDRISLEADGKLRFWLGRLVIWAVRFVLDQRSEARMSARSAKRATESS